MLPGEFWIEERTKLYELLFPFLVDAGLNAAGNALGMIGMAEGGVDWGRYNAMIDIWARDYAADLASGIAENDARYLAQIIPEWVRSGEPIQELETRLVHSGRWGEQRARTIAVTEVTRAFAQANILGWSLSGRVEALEWRTARDEIVCAICGPLHGKRVGMVPPSGLIQGVTEDATGGLGGFFTNFNWSQDVTVHHPPAHHNCRCWLQPVVIEAIPTDTTPWEEWGAGPDASPTVLPIAERTSPVPLKPAGALVGERLTRPKNPRHEDWTAINEAIGSIENIHGVPDDMPTIAIKRSKLSLGTHGQYVSTLFGDKALEIKVAVDDLIKLSQGQRALTTAHEIGHFLDHKAFGQSWATMAAKNGEGPLVDWVAAVKQTEGYQKLMAMTSTEKYTWWGQVLTYAKDAEGNYIFDAMGNVVRLVEERLMETTIQSGVISYYQSAKEVWARAYAQYVATRSEGTLLKEALAKELKDLATSNPMPTMWTAEDFEPIAKAFDELFESMGWRVP